MMGNNQPMLTSGEAVGTLDTLRISAASDIVELVVLTGDEIFLQTLREAVGDARRLKHVSSADKISDLLVAGEVGILVIDVQVLNETSTVFVGHIKRQFPDLVVVVAGHRDAEISLARLISAGMVYRFIHKPVSPGRAKLFADAAVKKYDEQRRRAAAIPPVKRHSTSNRGVLIGGTAGVLGAIVIAAWVMHRGGDPDAGAPRTARAAPVSAVSPLLTDAAAALAEARERLWSQAENALLEDRLDEAAAAIEAARKSGVDSGRIAFLTSQLAKSRERMQRAQAAARVRNEPPKAEEDKVTPLLQVAAQRIGEAHLIDPERDSALFYIQEALRLDPNSGAAHEAEKALALRLLTEAHGAIYTRDFAHATGWIEAAKGIAVADDIDAAQVELAAARREADADAGAELLKSATERLHQDRLIEPANDSAKYYLVALRGLDPGNAGLGPAIQEFGARLVARAHRDLDLGQYDAARGWLDEAGVVGFASPESASARRDLDAAVGRQQFLANVVAANDLTPIKSVQPIYPAKANSSKIQGWVELDFTVTESGAVKDIAVHAASTPGVFEVAAISALSQWRYKPVLRDAKSVAQRARIRIRFAQLD